MSRPRTPTHLKILKGEPESRIPRGEPIPALGDPKPPYRLTKDVQAVWDTLAPDRISKGLLTPWDVDAFALLCELVVLNRKALQAARKGVLVPGKRPNMLIYNRAMQGVRETSQLLNLIGGRFGWTPSDRARLNLHTPDVNQENDDLLS